MNAPLKKLLTPLASLRITVALLLAGMLLVYVGTLAQQTKDNFTVQKEFFHSWLVYMPFQDHVPFLSEGTKIPGGYMFLGGYSIIVGILVNLIAAHWLRFKFVLGDMMLVPLLGLATYLTWLAQASPEPLIVTLTVLTGAVALGVAAVLHGRRTGVIVIHFGLILILVGELVTALGQVETQMTLSEGDRQSWAQDIRHVELAVIDPAPADHDAVTAIPASQVGTDGAVVKVQNLPFEVRVDAYYKNAALAELASARPPVSATAGRGLKVAASPLRVYTGTGGDAGKVNAPAAYVTVVSGGKPVDTLLLWCGWDGGQRVTVDGKPYDLALRFKRYDKPYTIQLLDFKHEVFQGTGKAKNFAAHIRLLDPPNNVDREVTVRMNQPLRYAGDTIYQSGFDPDNDKITTLQIVRNPGWLMPYLACAVGGLGMLLHFGALLAAFIGIRVRWWWTTPIVVGIAALVAWWAGAILVGVDIAIVGMTFAFVLERSLAGRAAKLVSAVPAPPPLARQRMPEPRLTAYTLAPKSRALGWAVTGGLVLLTLIYIGAYLAPRPAVRAERKDFRLAEWGALPVNFDGRAMPLDSLARNSLKVISGKQTFNIVEQDKNGRPKDGPKVQAIEWLADVLSGRPEAKDYKVIRIDEPGVKAFFGLAPDEKLFSSGEIIPDGPPITLLPPTEWQAMPPGQFGFAAYAVGVGTGKIAGMSVSDMSPQANQLIQNVNRWAQQVGLPPPSPDMLASQLTPTTVGGGTGRRVDLSGPGTDDKGPLRTIAVLADRGQRTWVFKLTGPTDVVAAELPRFDAFLAAVGFNAKIEKVQAEFERVHEKSVAQKTSLDLYERKMLELRSHLSLFGRLKSRSELYLVPPLKADGTWRTLAEAGEARQAALANVPEADRPRTPSTEPAFDEVFVSLQAWRDGKPDEFNKAVANYQRLIGQKAPALTTKASFEQFFNGFSPFWVSVGLYIFALVLSCLSWIWVGGTLARGALAVLIISLLVHTFGIIARMYISGRPPVTNLYSSAVFISWVVVLLCVILEWMFKNGLAAVAGSLVGFVALLVSDGIEFADAVSRNEGDTMAQLQAVLDTNLWLATHVVMITMGYAAVFLAGALGMLYVIGGAISHFTRRSPEPMIDDVVTAEGRKVYVKMVYGVACFAMFLSFVGTILGGIWADQSWGRFWGWDSKENGAILIVLWVAIVLHARWSGLIRERGLMSLCILGNIVTAWSWFGTNELGIGLHAYGFTEGVVPALVAFWSLNVLFAVFAVTPWAKWKDGTDTVAKAKLPAAGR